MILAIDASTKSSGVAVFDGKKLEGYDCLTASSTDLIKRIQKIVKELDEKILSKYPIEKIILEEVRPENGQYGAGNIQTHRALMWLQAAIAFLVHDKYPQATIEYVYPSSWRAKCGIHTGRGIKRESLKEADIRFVKETYGLTVNDDIADAIAIGHSYVHDDNGEFNWD